MLFIRTHSYFYEDKIGGVKFPSKLEYIYYIIHDIPRINEIFKFRLPNNSKQILKVFRCL